MWGMPLAGSWKILGGSLDEPLVIAHRGGSALAPENTMAAFLTVVELGADGIELDVRLTKDHQVVVMHDRRLDRTTTGSGIVGTHTLKHLKSLDAGSWFGSQFQGERIPTLDEVFEELPDDFPIYVEMKARGPGAWPLTSRVVNIIRNHKRFESTMVASFNSAAVGLLRLFDGRIIRGYIWSGRHPLPLRARWFSPLANPHWLAPDWGTLTPELLARFHGQGMPVAAWDVDVGVDMRRLTEMRVDAVVTDHPDVLLVQRSSKYGEE